MSSNVIIEGSLVLSTSNTPTREGERVKTESDILKIVSPYVGMIVYIEDLDSFAYIKSLKDEIFDGFVIKDSLVGEYKLMPNRGLEIKVDNLEQLIIVLEQSIKTLVEIILDEFTNTITDNGTIDTFKELLEFANNYSDSQELILSISKIEDKNIEQDRRLDTVESKLQSVQIKTDTNTIAISNFNNTIDNKIESALSWDDVN